MSWSQWAWGSMLQLNAASRATAQTLWAWSNAETAPNDLMRWNNPLNSTEKWPGSVNSGAQPGPHDVQIYATVQDGIDATCYTLTQEPYYPAIASNLRSGLIYSQWSPTSSAGSELNTWGTGTGWLARVPYFGTALPAELEAIMSQLDDIQAKVDAIHASYMTTSLGETDPAILTDGNHLLDWFYRWNQQLKDNAAAVAALAVAVNAAKASADSAAANGAQVLAALKAGLKAS